MQPKSGFFHNGPNWSWMFKELNFVVGSYELINNKLVFDLTVQLENKHRNLLLLGIPTSTTISFYLGVGIELILLFAAMLGLAIWRVKEDTGFYRDLLTNELTEDDR